MGRPLQILRGWLRPAGKNYEATMQPQNWPWGNASTPLLPICTTTCKPRPYVFTVLQLYDHMMVHTLKLQSCTNLLRSYAVIDWKIGKLLKLRINVITTVHQKENRWARLTCSVGWEFLDLALKQFPSVYNASLHTDSFPQHPKTFCLSGLHISCRLCSTLTVSAITRFWSGQVLL